MANDRNSATEHDLTGLDGPVATSMNPLGLALLGYQFARTSLLFWSEMTDVVMRTGAAALKSKVDAPSQPEREGSPADRRPAVDDLKAIGGIGPKLQQALNGSGITTYAQIATLDEGSIKRLDDRFGLSGRIERDDWIGRARALSAAERKD